jgi:nucleoside-diphosphate-sugar epimerase
MKRVLVTGGTGFIGRNSLRALSERFDEVHAISRKPPVSRNDDTRWHLVNLFDEEEVSAVLGEIRATHLLHFAWSVEPGQFWASLENIRWVDVSLRLFRTFVENGGERVVATGSCAEYDWSSGICSERWTRTRPTSVYGVSKHALQLLLEAMACETGLSAAWGRVFFLYGPREPPSKLVASVIRSLLKGKPARTTAGTQLRDFLHVEDAASAFVALLSSEVKGAVNIGSGTPVAVREVVKRIAERLGRMDLVEMGAIPMPSDEPPLLVADTTRLNGEVQWQPGYTLEAGLDHTISWWKRRALEAQEGECA